MSDVKITIFQNGPLRVEGTAKLLDQEEIELPTDEGMPFFLCRCGASEKKPFCDGSYTRVGFDGS